MSIDTVIGILALILSGIGLYQNHQSKNRILKIESKTGINFAGNTISNNGTGININHK